MDLSDLFEVIRKYIWIILFSGIVLGVLAGIGTELFMTPMYQSTTKSLVLNQQDRDSITYSDFQSSTQFIADYNEVVQSRTVIQSVIESLDLSESMDELDKMTDVVVINDTHLLKITVTADSPEKAQSIAEKITITAAEMFEEMMNTDAVTIIDHADLPVHSSSPNLRVNVLLGFLTGWCLSVLTIVTRDLLDDKINTSEDFKNSFDYPLIGLIPYDGKLHKIKKKVSKGYVKGKRR